MRQRGCRPAGTAARQWQAWLIAGAVIGSLALSTPAAAVAKKVDCDSPNDFCTGDPCVVKDQIEVTVASCTLDFGARALQLRQVVFLPNNGSLSLSARSIEVRRHIDGTHVKFGDGDGADISLTATDDIAIYRPLDAMGQMSSGNIVLTAGGSIDLRERLRARAKGRAASAAGGSVTVQAGGMITSTHKGKIDVRGRLSHSVGGHAVVIGATGVRLEGKVDARGSAAGNIRIASDAGSVELKDEVLSNGSPGGGGTIEIEATGDVTASKRLAASGGQPAGGSIALTSGGVLTLSSAFADGRFGAPAGTVAATAASIVADRISVRADGRGGQLTLVSTAGDLDIDRVDVRSKNAIGGTVRITSSAGLSNPTGVKAEGGLAGGRVVYVAGGSITLGRSNSSRFDASTGGLIQASAGGDLTADGHFDVNGGCIALAAAGTLNIGSAQFDGPLSPNCGK